MVLSSPHNLVQATKVLIAVSLIELHAGATPPSPDNATKRDLVFVHRQEARFDRLIVWHVE
jgi:hypothetical protein